MTVGHDGGREFSLIFSPPVTFGDSPLSEGAFKYASHDDFHTQKADTENFPCPLF